jgi:hypothetical protein
MRGMSIGGGRNDEIGRGRKQRVWAAAITVVRRLHPDAASQATEATLKRVCSTNNPPRQQHCKLFVIICRLQCSHSTHLGPCERPLHVGTRWNDPPDTFGIGTRVSAPF